MAHCILYIYLYILTTTTSALVEKKEVRYITERSANGLTENTENPQTQLGGKIARDFSHYSTLESKGRTTIKGQKG